MEQSGDLPGASPRAACTAVDRAGPLRGTHKLRDTCPRAAADMVSDSQPQPAPEDAQSTGDKSQEGACGQGNESLSKEVNGNETHNNLDMPAAPDQDKMFNVKIQLPGADALDLQVSPRELVQEIVQVLMEHEDSCHRTCFSLQHEGSVLDSFSELTVVEGLKDGSLLKVIEEPYTIREVRIHIRHFRDLLKSLDPVDAYNGVDCNSLSFLNIISEGDIGDPACLENNGKKKKRISSDQGLESIDCSPPEYILPGSQERPLCPLQPMSTESKPTQCLKALMMSGWNPPPGNRKMHGDLMYLNVITLEDHHVNITASNRGFYINQSTADTFNPKPANPSHLSHSLVELFNQISPAFKKNFAALQKKRVHRHPLERIATPFQVYSWTAPCTNHIIDCVRAEDAYTSRMGYEEHIPGQVRDWNEELQTTKELPRILSTDQMLRERATYKINSDYVAASTRGAMAVIDGNIMAINPGEEPKMQMFIWNNIFFSLGFDVRDHYKELGGDHAAHVAASHDLKGVQVYSDLDIDELYVLGTVVLDYRGHRVTAQSIIPGILDRKEDQSVVYGSIDFGKTVSSNAKYLTLLQKASKPLRILKHKVLNEKEEEVMLCSSVECKGIVGNDGRHYILDLLRTFPPDLNFLPLDGEEMPEECHKMRFPRAYRHKLCCLRPELVDSFVQYKYTQFMNLVMDRSQKLSKENKGNKDDALGVDIIRDVCQEIGSVSDFIFDIRFNPDACSSVVRFPESEKEANQKQKRLLKEASAFLVSVKIPNFVKDCLEHVIVPLDGVTMTEALHRHGINVRYLGTIAEVIQQSENKPQLDHIHRIVIGEIVTRSAKHIIRRYLQGSEMSSLSAAVSHFLNCFLSSYLNPVAHLPADELQSRRRKGKRKVRNQENGDNSALTNMIPSELWKQIQKEVRDCFDFTLPCDGVDQLVKEFSIQKMTLLREFCVKAGIQISLREYNFDSRHKPAVTEEDILNMFPVVKHINVHAKDATRVLQTAKTTIQQGNIKEGAVLLNEAVVQFNNVYGAVHPEISMCLRLLAKLQYILGDVPSALETQQKAVIMTERTLGYDHPSAIQDYVFLALFCFANAQLPVALKLLYRARYLMLLVVGEDHPTMATLDSNIGIVLQAVSECDLAMRFLEKALEINTKYHGKKSLQTALSHHLVALVYTSKAEFRSAMQHEKETYTIYRSLLGDPHDRTKESSAFLKHVTQQAVNLQRTMNEIYKNGSSATIPRVQITPPGVETLLEQLNLINGILLINVRSKEEVTKDKQMETVEDGKVKDGAALGHTQVDVDSAKQTMATESPPETELTKTEPALEEELINNESAAEDKSKEILATKTAAEDSFTDSVTSRAVAADNPSVTKITNTQTDTEDKLTNIKPAGVVELTTMESSLNEEKIRSEPTVEDELPNGKPSTPDELTNTEPTPGNILIDAEPATEGQLLNGKHTAEDQLTKREHSSHDQLTNGEPTSQDKLTNGETATEESVTNGNTGAEDQLTKVEPTDDDQLTKGQPKCLEASAD
ncbi:clustered mitochondria protein homolog isoform X2 [Pleurodeles waltl]|uniref:clustered mitochondria protein homolog isoform X2 n=1 Tax=Pleurodeles waltl TaxID=8319 RepID=UPI0037094B2A